MSLLIQSLAHFTELMEHPIRDRHHSRYRERRNKQNKHKTLPSLDGCKVFNMSHGHKCYGEDSKEEEQEVPELERR